MALQQVGTNLDLALGNKQRYIYITRRRTGDYDRERCIHK